MWPWVGSLLRRACSGGCPSPGSATLCTNAIAAPRPVIRCAHSAARHRPGRRHPPMRNGSGEPARTAGPRPARSSTSGGVRNLRGSGASKRPEDHGAPGNAAAGAALGAMRGEAADAFAEYWELLVAGDEQFLVEAQQACEQLAGFGEKAPCGGCTVGEDLRSGNPEHLGSERVRCVGAPVLHRAVATTRSRGTTTTRR